MNTTVDTMELVAGKGRINFVTKNEDGTTNNFTHFGTIKGEGKWCKVLEPDQFDNYAVDIYGDVEHIKAEAEEINNKTKELVEAAGKKVNGIADFGKENDEGVEYIQFKRKGSKADGTPNTPPKVYDAQGKLQEEWDTLIGNGSKIGVAYMLSPYYMPSTKMVGVSCRFYAIQIIDLVEYKSGGGGSPFGAEETADETTTTEDMPF